MSWMVCAGVIAADGPGPTATAVWRSDERMIRRIGNGGARASAVRRADARTDPGPDTDASDATLLAAATCGEQSAFRAIVARYADRVFANCWRVLADRSEAEDAVQESFARLWRVLDEAGASAPDRDAGGWLMRTSRNLCIDRLRRRKRWIGDDATLAAQPDPSPSADARLQDRDLGTQVRDAIARLPDRQRTAIALVHFEGLAQAEAAQEMAISVDALESLLARGRRTLRDTLRARKEDLI